MSGRRPYPATRNGAPAPSPRADATTPRLGLVQPEVGASASSWGFKWNNNAVILDQALTTAGGTIAGPLAINGLFSTNQAADIGGTGIAYTGVGPGHVIAFGWDGSEIQEFVDGTYIGNVATQQWCDSVFATAASLAGYLPLTGGTLNGALGVAGNLSATGAVYSTSGRLFAQGASGGVPSVTLWNVPANMAMGFALNVSPYEELDFGQLDGSGNLANTTMFTRPDGTFGITGQGWKPGGGMWAAISDARLKKDVATYTAGLAELCALRPITYRYNGLAGTKNDGRLRHGLVAQEAEKVMPELVGMQRARLNSADQTYADILTLDPTPAFFALINAVRELAGRLAVVEAKL